MSLNLHLTAERARIRADGTPWERARCQFIINSPAAQGREAGAWVLAMCTDMPPQEAVDYLATLPIAAPPSSPSSSSNESAVMWADIAAGNRGGWKAATLLS